MADRQTNFLCVIVKLLSIVDGVVLKRSSTKETVYCGSKQPAQKDFALIINHKTGEFTLERLTYKLNLKRYVTQFTTEFDGQF